MYWNSTLCQNHTMLCQWLLGRWRWHKEFNMRARNSNFNTCLQSALRLANIPCELLRRHPYFTFIPENTYQETTVVTSAEPICLLWKKSAHEETSLHTLNNFWIGCRHTVPWLRKALQTTKPTLPHSSFLHRSFLEGCFVRTWISL